MHMAVQSLATVDQGIRAIRSAADARAHACRHRLRYRIAIVAPDVIDAVRSVGGWVFDRVMAGWEVTVLVPDLVDPAPLRMLGAIVLNLDDALSAPPIGGRIWPHELVVAATVFDSDARVRAGVTDNLAAHAGEIMFWGGDDCDGRVCGIEHRLSAAARAFKAGALALAGDSFEPVPGVETFHRRAAAQGDLVNLRPRKRADGPDSRNDRTGDAVIIDITRARRRPEARE